MFFKKTKSQIEYQKLRIESLEISIKSLWDYTKALLDAEKQNRKDLNNVIAKINQMKPKGKK